MLAPLSNYWGGPAPLAPPLPTPMLLEKALGKKGFNVQESKLKVTKICFIFVKIVVKCENLPIQLTMPLYRHQMLVLYLSLVCLWVSIQNVDILL